MNCKKTQKLLVEELERPLDERERRLLREHLAACSECRRVAEGLRVAEELLDEWSVPEPDENLPLLVMKRVTAEAEESRARVPGWGLGWLHRALVPMIVAAGLLLGFLLGSQLERVASPGHASLATRTQELEFFSDPQSGSLTEAFEAVTLVSTGR
ncbi:MAG: hypothetical protein GXO73_06130 [Calditrichaeota bacterium]|nr:hypothetical protein [Calditrichota bacterium]